MPDFHRTIGRERRERVSHDDWSGDASVNSRRRVNSTVRHLLCCTKVTNGNRSLTTSSFAYELALFVRCNHSICLWSLPWAANGSASRLYAASLGGTALDYRLVVALRQSQASRRLGLRYGVLPLSRMAARDAVLSRQDARRQRASYYLGFYWRLLWCGYRWDHRFGSGCCSQRTTIIVGRCRTNRCR